MYTIKIGRDRPNEQTLKGIEAGAKTDVGTREIKL
jgi:hypothetical protein